MLRYLAFFAVIAVARGLHGPTCVRCNKARDDEATCNYQKGDPGTVECDPGEVCTTDVRCDGKGRLFFIKGCQKHPTAMDTRICNPEYTRCHYHCDTDMCNEYVPANVISALVCTPTPTPPPMGPMCTKCNQARDSEEKCNTQPGMDGNMVQCSPDQVCTTDVRCDGQGRLFFIKGCENKSGITKYDELICNPTDTRCHFHCTDGDFCNENAPPAVWESLVCYDDEICDAEEALDQCEILLEPPISECIAELEECDPDWLFDCIEAFCDGTWCEFMLDLISTCEDIVEVPIPDECPVPPTPTPPTPPPTTTEDPCEDTVTITNGENCECECTCELDECPTTPEPPTPTPEPPTPTPEPPTPTPEPPTPTPEPPTPTPEPPTPTPEPPTPTPEPPTPTPEPPTPTPEPPTPTPEPPTPTPEPPTPTPEPPTPTPEPPTTTSTPEPTTSTTTTTTTPEPTTTTTPEPPTTTTATTTPPTTTLVCEDSLLDIIFVVDSSGSIGISNYLLVRQFLTSVIGALEIGEDAIRVGIIHFSEFHTVDWSLQDGAGPKPNILNTATNLPYDAATTATYAAIDEMVNQFQNFGRPEAIPVGVVITDGQSNHQDFTAQSMLDARDAIEDLVTIAVAVDRPVLGDNVDMNELRLIATGPGDSNVLCVSDFDELVSQVSYVAGLICEPDGDPFEECDEILLMDGFKVWEDEFGVYELSTETCNGSPVYTHTSGQYHMFYSASVPAVPGVGTNVDIWALSPIICGGIPKAVFEATDSTIPTSDAWSVFDSDSSTYVVDPDKIYWSVCF